MAELDSKSNEKLWKNAKDVLVEMERRCGSMTYRMGLVDAMNPKRLTQCDIDTLEDIIHLYGSIKNIH